MSNLKRVNGKSLCGSLNHLIKVINNVKIGFFGVVDENYVDTTIFDEDELIFEDPIKVSKKMVKFFKKESCDLIVALTH